MKKRWMIPLLTLLVAVAAVAPASAHRPYFEDVDLTAAKPWQVDDPTISTAVYATLDSSQDVDYYAFDGRKGQAILISMTIPQITGQELFAPEMALFGPGLGAGELPARVEKPAGAGALPIPALIGPAKTFYEPFSRTSYWVRQEQRVTLPSDGHYVVAVWHAEGQVGRYTFVIGEKERLGGDLAFGRKLRDFWTPVPAPTPVAVPQAPDAAPQLTPAMRHWYLWGGQP
jgi:hypothetical protein